VPRALPYDTSVITFKPRAAEAALSVTADTM